MAQHTKGDWKISPEPDRNTVSHHDGHPFTIDVNGKCICKVCHQCGEESANALLISLAPNMLDALGELIAELDIANRNAINDGLVFKVKNDTGGIVLARAIIERIKRGD